jgi:hypothetical protein
MRDPRLFFGEEDHVSPTKTLGVVRAPTLLFVGGHDREVLALNKSALTSMNCKTLMVIIAGAGHLFEEVGALEKALAAAEEWYDKHLLAERWGSHRFACGIRAGAGRPSGRQARFGERVKRGIPSCPLN